MVGVCYFDWMPDTADLEQGLILLVRCIDNLNMNVGGMINKFSDDMNIV